MLDPVQEALAFARAGDVARALACLDPGAAQSDDAVSLLFILLEDVDVDAQGALASQMLDRTLTPPRRATWLLRRARIEMARDCARAALPDLAAVLALAATAEQHDAARRMLASALAAPAQTAAGSGPAAPRNRGGRL